MVTSRRHGYLLYAVPARARGDVVVGVVRVVPDDHVLVEVVVVVESRPRALELPVHRGQRSASATECNLLAKLFVSLRHIVHFELKTHFTRGIHGSLTMVSKPGVLSSRQSMCAENHLRSHPCHATFPLKDKLTHAHTHTFTQEKVDTWIFTQPVKGTHTSTLFSAQFSP